MMMEDYTNFETTIFNYEGKHSVFFGHYRDVWNW
jgi:hypothetical protein